MSFVALGPTNQWGVYVGGIDPLPQKGDRVVVIRRDGLHVPVILLQEVPPVEGVVPPFTWTFRRVGAMYHGGNIEDAVATADARISREDTERGAFDQAREDEAWQRFNQLGEPSQPAAPQERSENEDEVDWSFRFASLEYD